MLPNDSAARLESSPMEKTREIVLALVVNLVAGILVYFSTQDWRLTLIIVLVLLSASISFFLVFLSYFSYRRVGIYAWAYKRGISTNFRECLQGVSSSVDFLASWGGSIPSLTPH